MNKIENNASQQQKKPKHGDFWHQMGAIVLGTTISLIVTIAAAQILERHQRAKDRRLSALIVMSNIESTALNLEDGYAYVEEDWTAFSKEMDDARDEILYHRAGTVRVYQDAREGNQIG